MQKHPESLENQQALRSLIETARTKIIPEDYQYVEQAHGEDEGRDRKRQRRSR